MGNGRLVKMTDEEYFKPGCVSSTFLKTCALQSLAHAKADEEIPRKPTPQMALGSALHARVLEPDVYEKKWANSVLFTGKNDTAEGRARDLAGMVASLKEHPVASELLFGEGPTEQVILWEESGLECRAKIDKIAGHDLIDLKSAADASKRGFEGATFRNYRYDIQAAWYSRGARAAGIDVARFLFVVVESKPPYPCAVYAIDAAAVDHADDEIDRILPRIATARSSGTWPAYSTVVETLYLPAWMAGD